MKKQLLLFFLFCCASVSNAQTVTFNGTGGLLIPPGAPAQTVGVTQSPCVVSGVGIIGGCVSIANVEINLNHTWVGDIGILLIGPGGQVLELSTGNGGSGDNYNNTVFSDDAGQFVTAGAPPFTGNFRPEGRVTNLNNPYSNFPALGTNTFASTYNGTNADGTWILYVNDYVSLDIGEIISWSITVNPLVTTTYTVTVTSAGCGTDTDEVTVNVRPIPAVSFSVPSVDFCEGSCKTITASFTGTAPFTLSYTTPAGAFSQTFPGSSGTFQVCAPAGAPPGSFSIQATALTDAFCTCQ